MKKFLRQQLSKFDALSIRERVLVAGAVLGGAIFAAVSLWIEPDRQRAHLAEQSMSVKLLQRQMLQAQIAVLQSPESSREVVARKELEALKVQLAEKGDRLTALESVLVPPQQMVDLLERMVGGRNGPRLLSLRTLPPLPLLEKKEANAGGDGPKTAALKFGESVEAAGLFKHGVELRLEGSYADLAEYLIRLEKLPQKLLWSKASLSAEQHPKVVLNLTVFTLSMDRAWLVF